MKKIGLFILMLLIFGIILIGCNNQTPLKDGANDNGVINNEDINNDDATNDKATKDDNVKYRVFEATVINSVEGLLISPDKDTVAYKSSDKIYVATNDAEIFDDENNIADLDILKPGDRIRISYDGLIEESYPAQITADKIELIGHNYVIDGFLALIDDIYQEDVGLNGGITMIGFDTTDWTMISEIETEIILANVKEKYRLEVIVGTFDELAEQELIDKDNLYFENGILIEINDIEINNDKDKIKCSIKKWRSGLGAIGWDAEAKLDKDTWEIKRKAMWIS
ncbi:MAG: DUF3221 domain-containing protein [Herbinix sp.]|nr:DUF3221 domain-containing protein [Herbinix sp.]